MAKFEEIGVIAVVDGFEAFVLKLTAMNKNVKRFGAGAATASGGIRLLNFALKTVAIAGAAAIAVIGAVAIGVAKIAVESVQTAASFETAFAGILKTTNKLGTNLFDLTDAGERVFQQFRDLAKEIPLSFEELAKIGEFAGQLGVPEQALASFTETVAALGVSTELTTEEASLGLARLGNVYGITADEMAANTERLGSTIVFLGNNFNALEPEILNFARIMAGTANAVGITQDELLAISTAFVATGVNAEAGGSSIQRVLLEMSKSVQTGGRDLRKWAEATGMTAQEFADTWGEEGGPARAFEAFVQRLAEEGQGAALVLEDLDVDTIRVLRTFLAGAGAADILSDALAGGADAWEANTALAREAEIRYATLDSQVQIVKNRFRDFATTIGLLLIPKVLEFIDNLQPFIDGLEIGLEPALKTVGDSIRENLLPALGDLISALTGEEIDFEKLKPEEVAKAIDSIGESIAEHIEDFSKFVENLAAFVEVTKSEGFKEGAETFGKLQFGLTDEDIERIEELSRVLAIAIPVILIAALALGLLTAPFTLLLISIVILMLLIKRFGPTVATAFEQLGLIIANWATETAETINKWIQDRIADITEWATNLGTTISDFFTITIPEKIAEGKEAVKTKLEEWRTAIIEKWEEIKTSISEKWEEIKENIALKIEEVKQSLIDKWEEIKTSIGEKWDEIVEGFSEWLQDIIDGIEEFSSNFVQAGKDIVGGIIDGINAKGQQIVDALVGWARNAWSDIKDFFNTGSPSKLMIKTVGEPIAEGMAVGIRNKAGLAQSEMLQMAIGTVNAADMLLPPAAAATSQTLDRSFNMGDMNVTAQPENPVTIAQRLSMMSALGN